MSHTKRVIPGSTFLLFNAGQASFLSGHWLRSLTIDVSATRSCVREENMADIESNGGRYKPEQGPAAYDFGPSESREEALQRVRTAGSLTISPELFEKLYLTPKTPRKGNLQGIIGNPSPL